MSHVAFSPDGATLASFAEGAYLWDPSTGRELRHIETGMAQALAYAPDGHSLAIQALEVRDPFVPGKPRRVFPVTSFYDPSTGREIRRFEGEGTANCLAFSPDGIVLAEGIPDGPKAGVTLREAATGRVLRSMGGSFAGTTALVFSPDGKVLISCVSWTSPDPVGDVSQPAEPAESVIGLWDVTTGKEIRRIGMGKTRINRAVLAPDGNTLATGATDKTIRLWDLATGQEIRRFGRGDEEPFGIAFSPDGAKLASTEAVGPDFPAPGESLPLTAPLHVWDAATGRELRHWATDNNSLACFSPDGTTLVSVGGQVIRLWEVASGREIRPQAGHRSAIEDALSRPILSPL